jgi:hypothetical protein
MHDDPEGKRLPIKLDSTSDGEFAPVPLWPENVEANRLAHEAAATPPPTPPAATAWPGRCAARAA